MAEQAKKEKSCGGCTLGCGGVLLLLWFLMHGGSGSQLPAVVASKPAYIHQTPMIHDGLNSVWVFYESKVYKSPKEENPVGQIARKASVIVEPVDYDWVKIYVAPVRPVGGGDFVEKEKGLYIKRHNLITSSPERWPK